MARTTTTAGRSRKAPPRPVEELLPEALGWLQRNADPEVRAGMARYAIPSDHAFGIPVGELRRYAKELGRSHELAGALWENGAYEARLLAVFVEEPALVTPAQMERWSRDFDNWAVCDTACFHLFDRTPHAWSLVDRFSARSDEFGRRAAFALLASLSVHDKAAEDACFLHGLELIEAAAGDDRNFVKKAVNWALRSIGKRNATLHAAAVEVARRLADAEAAPARWVGRDALRELTSAAVVARLAKPRPKKAR